MKKNTPKVQKYDPKKIESKWMKIWEKKKFHVLDMFPYPSGEGLHVGHAKTFGGSDVYTRFKRLQGFNVLHATGWDAFGLPAEQFALKMKTNPKIQTKKNTDNFERQMKRIGFSYDWERTVNTTDPEFYKWTQWIFKQLYKDGLCEESFEPINWCPSCKTGLANEDLEDGKCERCGSVVEKKPIRQWVIKITKYAEKLLSGLEEVGWKENIKEMQRNWIGKNVGVEYKLKIKDTDLEVKTYSTHFEAFYADTFAVIAPDHKMLGDIVGGLDKQYEVLDFAKKLVDKKTKAGFKEIEDHEGIFTGRYLVDPITNSYLPLWVASYALSDYGTGIIKCSAHDTRDFSFAKKYNLPLRTVMYPDNQEEKDKIKNLEYCFSDFSSATLELPNEFKGRKPLEAHDDIVKYLVEHKFAIQSTQYKLRDWVFARQRYWGEPFPIVFDENHKSYLVADKDLPVKLPDVKNYEPTGDGESPLKNIKNWVEVYGTINKDGEFEEYKKKVTKEILKKGKIKKFTRETNTMPQWAGSSWYWLRYMDPKNKKAMVDKKAEKYWGQVDMYIGGMEHATRHLIYGRFWNRFLFDKKIISTKEPFQRLEAVGLVLGPGGVKMSKRLGNVINPDDICNMFGADTLRTYISFSSSFHDSFSWDEKAIVGSRRFIERVWSMQSKVTTKGTPLLKGVDTNAVSAGDLETILHQTIKKCEEDYEKMQYNTAIAQMMIFVNAVEKAGGLTKDQFVKFVTLLSPVAPFVTSEILENLKVKNVLWPKWDAKKIQSKNVNIALQINGKLRDTFACAVDLGDEEVKKLAEQTEGYKKWVVEAGVQIRKIIVVKNKIVNVVL